MAVEEGHDGEIARCEEMAVAVHEFVAAVAAHSAIHDGSENWERIGWVEAAATFVSGRTHTMAGAFVPLRSRKYSSVSAVAAAAMDPPAMALVVSAALATGLSDMFVADVAAERTPVGS